MEIKKKKKHSNHRVGLWVSKHEGSKKRLLKWVEEGAETLSRE